MDQETKRLHYGLAALSFLIAFITYLRTMQPTIPFWDCGEFASAAWALQVPHPPGAPLWTMIGRLGMLLPTFSDPVARYNLLSVLSSAGSIMLLYLTLVRFIKQWRGLPQTGSEAIITLGGAFIGALAYTWTDSFWFNAVECEVYAFGSLFISLVPWLVMVWHDHADEPGNEKYLLLIAYVIGLSLGVHQLALLTMFPVFMIVYYHRRKEVTVASWLLMVLASVVLFVIIFMIVLTKLVAWAGAGQGILSVIILLAMVASVIYAERTRKPNLALFSWTVGLVFLGYTTYGMVMVRASQNPPMNENAPSNFSRLAGYINRDQYGEWKLFPRRLEDQKASHQSTWENYSSSADFFWRYQTNFMFHRYLGWNFIGRQDDDQGAGVDSNKTFGLPFLLGLFGLYWHFRKDPKRAFSLLGMFVFLGYFTVWYQNQQDPQPRERDYFYVGAFYVFAMWIGIGATGLMELVQEAFSKREKRASVALIATFVILLVIAPLNMVAGLGGRLMGQPFSQSSKWAEYSREHNKLPWEYAYNILQSCEPNAVLFTYGDNDTFPLWCLQDVYGIRRDIRIVQLQLASMMWYVEQLRKDNDWGAKSLKLTAFTDDVVHMSDDEAYKHLDWDPKPLAIPVTAQAAKWIVGSDSVGATEMNWKPQIQMPTDILVEDIILNNINDRPIYYSVTVPENARAGLNKYLIYEGLAARVTPFPQPPDPSGIGGAVQTARYSAWAFNAPTTPAKTASRGMMLDTYRDPVSHRSSMDDSYSMTFRFAYIRLGNWLVDQGDLAGAKRAVDSLEAKVPVAKVGLDFPYASIVSDIAEKSGDFTISRKYALAGVRDMESRMKNPNWHEEDRYARQMQGVDYQYADLLMKAGILDAAKQEFETLKSRNPDQAPLMDLKLKEVEARRMEAAGNKSAAAQLFTEILTAYQNSGGQARASELLDIRNHILANQ